MEELSTSNPPGDRRGESEPAEDQFAASLRRFRPAGLPAILAILAGNLLAIPFSAVLVLVGVHLSRTPWKTIGYARPTSWIGSLGGGVVLGTILKLLMKALVMPLLGAPLINAAYRYLAGNQAAIAGALFAGVVGAGFGEETLFRGFLFERLGRRFGAHPGAKALI
jgi:membrane protease YdiL (CAAX protease family)